MRIRLDGWAVLTAIMVVIALFFGLRPRAWFVENDVQWLPDAGGLRFQGNGMAYVRGLQLDLPAKNPGAFTIELAAAPGTLQRLGFSPLLVLHDGIDDRQLAVWQYHRSLIVMNGDDYDYRQRRPRVVARDVLSTDRMRLLTITSGEKGTRLFVDGVLAAAKDAWRLAIPRQTQPLLLVLGNSVYGKHGWTGSLYGVAFFAEAIQPASVKRRFDLWTASRDFSRLGEPSPWLRYTFDNSTGGVISDPSGGHPHLERPAHLKALKKTLLSLPGREFRWNRSVVGDMVINFFGFMPLGLVFGAFLQRSCGLGDRRSLPIALAMCLLLSLSIEIAQAWIPNRTSSLPDLMLNVVGGLLGILVWRKGAGAWTVN